MNKSILPLLFFSFIMVKINAQDIKNNIQDFKQDENLAPHIHLHENGYYYVTEDFLHPSGDRGIKPVLDSITFVNVTSNGDTSYKYEHHFTISDENRIIQIKKRENYPSSSQGYVTRDVFITYEMDGDDIIQFDTIFSYLQAGEGGLNANFITHINSQGFVTRIQSQGYYNGEWMNAYLYVADFNEFGCLLSKNEYSWKENKWNPTYSWRFTCEESLKTTEFYSRYNLLDTIEIPAQLTEYEYDEFDRLSKATILQPKSDDPLEYRIYAVKLYTYDENNLNDSIITQGWDEINQEFNRYNIITFEYDEFKNIKGWKMYYKEESNNWKLESTWDYNFNNDFLIGDFLSGSINSDLNSMLLKQTYKSTAFLLVETQYFYSGGGVNSTQKVNNINFDIYPNPTSGELNINISDLITPNSSIMIRNSSGMLVWSQIADSRNSLNVGHLPSGFYLISVEGQSFRSEVKKLIVQ